MNSDGRLSESWQPYLGEMLASVPMRHLSAFLRAEKAKDRLAERIKRSKRSGASEEEEEEEPEEEEEEEEEDKKPSDEDE